MGIKRSNGNGKKVRNELLEQYQQSALEEKEAEKACKAAGKVLAKAEGDLMSAILVHEELTKKQSSPELLTIEKIEVAKDKTEAAERKLATAKQAKSNCLKAVQNSAKALKQAQDKGRQLQQRLFQEQKVKILDEIKKKVGDLLPRYLNCVLNGYANIVPSGFELIEDFLHEARQKETRDSEMALILKG